MKPAACTSMELIGSRVVLSAALVLAASLLLARSAYAQAFRPFSFALVGDPQIGYGRGGEYADTGRFQKVADGIAARGIPLTLVAGDLVQDRDIWQHWLFGLVRGHMRGHVALAAGNHDIVDRASLARFRSRYGKDYFDLVFNDCAFVVIDSETARDRSISPAEFDRQWAFIEARLAAHDRAGRAHIVLVMHRPPFVEQESEPVDGRNWPLETRRRLLSLARQHGVRWILAGHLHRTVTAQTQDGLHVVVAAGSARSFDQSPIGYRLFRVQRDGIEHELVVVAPAPAEPFSVPGLRDWTPRIFDFSTRHWLFTLAYVLAGMSALSAAGAMARRPDPGFSAHAALWRSIAGFLFFFGANMQLDVDEFIREVGRILAKLTGVYPVRHLVTGTASAGLVIGSAVLLGRFYVRSGRETLLTIALGLLSLPSAWFLLSVISHHYIGMLWSEMWWDLSIVVALSGIALCARLAAASTRPRATEAVTGRKT